MATVQRFTAYLRPSGRGGGGHLVEVPDEIVQALGGKGRTPVKATFNGIPYRGSIVKIGGIHMLDVLKNIMAEAGVEAGGRLDVTVELDAAQRTVEAPPDLAGALNEHPKAREAWEKLSFTHRREHAEAIAGAKKPETRTRRPPEGATTEDLRAPPGHLSAVDAVVSRGMAKKPADRYESAGRFATALRDSLVPEGQTSPAILRRPRRRWPLLVAAALAVVVGVALFAALSNRSGSNPTHTPSAEASGTSGQNPAASLVGVIRLNRTTGTTIPIEAPLAASDVSADKTIVIGGSSVWLYDSQAGTLYRISPETNRVVNDDRFRSGSAITYGHDALWMAPLFFDASHQLRRIDPTTISVDADVRVRDGSDCCTAIAFGDDRVWVLGSAVLRRVDPVTQEVRDIHVSGTALEASPGKVWVLDISGQLTPFDANSRSPGPPVPLPANPVAVAVSSDAVWVLQKGDADVPGQVQKIPLSGGGGIQTVAVGTRPNDIVVAPDGSVWVACFGDGTVWEIDPIAVTSRSFSVGGHPSHIAVDDDGVWIVSEFPTNAFGA